MSTAAYASEPNLRRAGSTALPLVVAIIIVLFLSVPDQMREIYRLHAGAWNSVSWSLLQPVYALIALMALSFFLWRIARELASTSVGSFLRGSDHWSRTVLTWIPRIVATLPLAGMALGLWLGAKVSAPAGDVPVVFERIAPLLLGLPQTLLRASVFYALLALAVLATVSSIEIFAARKTANDRFRRKLLDWWPLYAGMLVLMTIASAVLGSTAFVHLGVIPLVALWLFQSWDCSPICGG